MIAAIMAVAVLLFIAGFALGFYSGKQHPAQAEPAESEDTKRARREYLNFLTYDGSEQEEIR